MQRREFLRCLGGGLAAAWAGSRWGLPAAAQAADGPPRLALLADAHLRDGNARRVEARALARAAAEIRALKPPPDLVLFAGDLAHDGNTQALALGREILADLPGPLLSVMGEGDGIGKGTAAWSRLFGEPRFSYVFHTCPNKKSPPKPGERAENLDSYFLPKTENRKPKTIFQVLGVNTSLSASPQGPVFAVGLEQRRWLAQELARLDPARPLIILSHAPLVEIFRPWRQWTQDGPEVMRLLSRFSRVFCFHGHVHHGAFSYDSMGPDEFFLTENRKLKTANHPLPATAWPLPSPLQGTPAAPRPGLGPRGCGWGLVSLGRDSLKYQPQVWQA